MSCLNERLQADRESEIFIKEQERAEEQKQMEIEKKGNAYSSLP